MIYHIVMFNFKDSAEGADKDANMEEVKNVLNELPAKIPQIIEYQCGINTSGSPSAMDFCLVSSFETVDDLNKYREHPEHLKALDFILKVITESKVSDFEI